LRVPSEAEVQREVSPVLVEHLSPAKMVRFWAGWQTGRGAYLQWGLDLRLGHLLDGRLPKPSPNHRI